MIEILKMLKELVAKGYATKEEKAKAKELFEALKDEEKDVLKKDIEDADKLPEEEEEENKEEEGKEEDVEKSLKTLLSKTNIEFKKEAIDSVKEEVKTWMKEQRELITKQAGVYQPEIRAERKRMNEYTREFCRAIVGNDIAKLKEMSTDSTGTPYGGYVVDSELSAEIRHIATEYGVARKEMFALQLSKNSYKANELVTDVTVSWADEASAISSSQIVLGQDTLELKKLAAIVTLTSELLEDEEVDLFSFITQRVGEGFAEKEDLAFFVGDGTSTYGSFTGLLNSSSVNEVTMSGATFASIDADDLIDMVDATPSGALKNSKFYLDRTIMSYIRKLKDTDNQYIYQKPSEKGPATIWGYPAVLVEAMPGKNDSAAGTSFVLFGDLKLGCIFGYRGEIRAKRFDAGLVKDVAGSGTINLITTDREAMRWIERVGYMQVIKTLNKPITKLTTAVASA